MPIGLSCKSMCFGTRVLFHVFTFQVMIFLFRGLICFAFFRRPSSIYARRADS